MAKKIMIDEVEFDTDVVMEMFRNIFEYIGSYVLGYNDQELECVIYEDYDFCYVHMEDFRLDILYDNGFITDDIRQKAKEMKSLTDKMLDKSVERSAYIVRNSVEWKQIISLADQIRIFLYN